MRGSGVTSSLERPSLLSPLMHPSSCLLPACARPLTTLLVPGPRPNFLRHSSWTPLIDAPSPSLTSLAAGTGYPGFSPAPEIDIFKSAKSFRMSGQVSALYISVCFNQLCMPVGGVSAIQRIN